MATKTKDKAQTSAQQSKSPGAPETYTCAMDKLRDEMARGKGRYVQVVGEYLTDYLLRHPEAEGKLMAKGKSIAGSLQAMRDEAEKVKDGNVAVLDDQTAFGIVLRYFGIEGGATAEAGKQGNREQGTGKQGNREQGTGNRNGLEPATDPFDLDALMGGL